MAEQLSTTCTLVAVQPQKSDKPVLAGVALLGKFISVREPNIRYLGLENMVRLAEVPAVADTVNRCAVGGCCTASLC